MVDSTISGSPGIIINAVNTPTKACPIPISTSELDMPSISEGPTKMKAMPEKKAEMMIVTRLSIFLGMYWTAILAGM